MKLSPQWIRDFVDLTVDDRRLAEDLTNVGISVEGISGSGGDTVFEMEIGTNRPDAMNHYGVARKKPSSLETDTTLARSTPSTRTLMLPSGSLRLWTMLTIDRKSTRLNSSHLGISYAVFCL